MAGRENEKRKGGGETLKGTGDISKGEKRGRGIPQDPQKKRV